MLTGSFSSHLFYIEGTTCEKLVATDPQRLAAVIAEKGTFTCSAHGKHMAEV